MTTGAPVDRRGFLALTAGLLLAAGCDGEPSTGGTTSTRPPAGASSTGRTDQTPPTADRPSARASVGALPRVRAWTPDAGDLQPQAKAEAARVVEALGNWRLGGAGEGAAAARLRSLGVDGRLAEQARLLLPPAPAAALQVVEAQYGGLLTSTASVLVVCRQWFGSPSAPPAAGGRTVDVRLRASGPRWSVTALYPGTPGPPSSPVSALARSVLESRRIELPPAGRADVLSGHVHPSVLEALLSLAATHSIGISVVRSGHPRYVFGTTRLSDHPQGRAFDTFRIDGRLVVDPATPAALVTAYMRAAVLAGSYNVGGPAIPLGGGSAFFSDATHHDHVHAGFLT